MIVFNFHAVSITPTSLLFFLKFSDKIDAKKSTLLPFFKKYIEHISKYEEIIAGAIAKDFGLILDGFSKILSGTDLLIFLNCFKLLARKGISNRTGDAKFGDPQKVPSSYHHDKFRSITKIVFIC